MGATRERMLREIAEALETITSDKPLLLVLEDLHWVDPSTVDLISTLARRRSPGKLMLLGHVSPLASEHPIEDSQAGPAGASVVPQDRIAAAGGNRGG